MRSARPETKRIGSIIAITINVKPRIINIRTISLNYTSISSDIQYNLIIIRSNGRAVVTTM